MRFDVITIFPNIFQGFLTESLISRGQNKKIIKINIHNLRKWATDRHKTVDDKPYGGGPGMVLKIEPIYKAMMALKTQTNSKSKKIKNHKLQTRVILFSPRGKKFTQKDAKRLAKYDQLILICGRYEGVDERVTKHIADETISIGDYVLNGGETAAMVLIEAVSRVIPGFIAKKESAEKPDHPQYTRPEVFSIDKKKTRVPRVLLSGDHKKIEEWRKKYSRT